MVFVFYSRRRNAGGLLSLLQPSDLRQGLWTNDLIRRKGHLLSNLLSTSRRKSCLASVSWSGCACIAPSAVPFNLGFSRGFAFSGALGCLVRWVFGPSD